jgi:hypothetical protein
MVQSDFVVSLETLCRQSVGWRKRLIIASAVASVACGSQASSDSLSESQRLESRVSSALLQQGLHYQSLQVDSQRWEATIDGDVVMSLDGLLGSAKVGDDAQSLLHTEGYSTVCSAVHNVVVCGPDSGKVPNVSQIRLKFGPGVSAAWQTAFTTAAQRWSTNVCIEIVPSGGSVSNGITVSVADFGSGNRAVYANADFPGPLKTCGAHCQFYPVGTGIRINTTFGCQDLPPNGTICQGTQTPSESLSAGLKLHVALHELGHTLGFLHPENANSLSLIPGTANAGASAPATATVMHANFGDTVTGLSSDDVLSRDKIYRAPCSAPAP